MTEQTIGEKRVRVSFNPSKDNGVDRFKHVAAMFIDMCHEADIDADAETKRLWALAMTHIEDAAMWAVKAATIQK